jgi:pimeloyl-ACP methyl ester carboxylesterase
VQRAAPHALHRCALSSSAERRQTFRQTLEGLAIPRTYLAGTRSLPPGASAVSGRYNGVDLAFVAEAGHLMYVDNPDGFACAVADAFGAR